MPRSSHALAATLAAFVLVTLQALLGPAPARGAISGPCTVTVTATSSGPVDVGSTDVLHLQSSDTVSAVATSDVTQTSVGAAISAFGFEIPVGSATSTGDTTISSDLFDASILGAIGRVFVLHGSSSGGTGAIACEASLALVLDDVNPFLTALGIAGSVGVLLGGLVLVRAFRNPGRRVVSGLAGLAALAAGLSLVLQQTSTPGAAAEPVAASPWAASVPSPSAITVDPVFLGWSALLALAVVLLLPFPADLFNQTLDHNAGRIRRGLRRLPLVGRLVARERLAAAAVERVTSRQHPIVIIGFLVLAAALYGFLSPTFGADEASLLTYLGILAALLVEAWLTAAPERAAHRLHDGDAGALRVVPATLVVAAVCVVISRLAGFQPGYLYGLLIGYAFARELSVADDGRAAAAGAAWLLGLGLVSWFALGAVRTQGISPSLVQSVAEAVFAALVVAGLQGLAFGMLPLRFLHGEPLFRWSRARWSVLYVPGLVAFALVILNPDNGFLAGSTTPFWVTAGLFIAFGAASILFWAWFRFRPAEQAEAAEPQPGPAAPA